MSADNQFKHDKANADRAKAIWADPEVPNIYCNDYIVSLTSADVVLVMLCNQKPVGVLNIPHGLAASLAEKLTQGIDSIGEACGHKVLGTDAVRDALSKVRGEEDTGGASDD